MLERKKNPQPHYEKTQNCQSDYLFTRDAENYQMEKHKGGSSHLILKATKSG